jgi:hypothetical protein
MLLFDILQKITLTKVPRVLNIFYRATLSGVNITLTGCHVLQYLWRGIYKNKELESPMA